MLNVALLVQAGIRRHQAEQQLQSRRIQRDEGLAAERIQSSWLQRQRRQQVASERTRTKLRSGHLKHARLMFTYIFIARVCAG